MVRTLIELTLSVALGMALFLGIDMVTARSFVDGPSMEPALQKGQALLISRLGMSGLTRQVYAATHPDVPFAVDGRVPPRGAIVTFVHPTAPGRLLVKRVIALPGEEIGMESGTVYISGRTLDEPYVVHNDRRNMASIVVPLNAVFVMGDNRPASGDSRSFGPVLRSSLLGVVVLRYWPLTDLRLMVDGVWQ